MSNLAIDYGRLGPYSDAMRLEKQVLEQRKFAFGPDHPDTVLAVANLVVTYHLLGRYSAAVELEEQFLE